MHNSNHQDNNDPTNGNRSDVACTDAGKNIFEKFDDHAIIYLLGLAILISMFSKPLHGDYFSFAFGLWIILCLAYYTLKAIFITSSTVINWERDNPGVPFFRAGGVTEYDQGFADAIGKAVGEEMRCSGTEKTCKLTEYDREMAIEIARQMKKME